MRKRIKCFTEIVLLCLLLGGCGTDRALVLQNAADVREDSDSAAGEWDGADAPADADVIYVYVCGAVDSPRVVTLPPGSRGYEAVEAAGGFAENAAQEAVNLAESLTDGQRFYIPAREEADAAEAERKAAESGMVNINQADAAVLCTLPGIGGARAEAIIAYRESNGGFQVPEDIMKVPGIKEGAFEKIKDRITVK